MGININTGMDMGMDMNEKDMAAEGTNIKHLFILNPKAGKINKTDELRRKIDRMMAARGDDYEIMLTEYEGHATAIAEDAASMGGPLRVYACGGDGTLNEVLNGVVGFGNVELTHFPSGTGNDFIKLFGRMASRFFSLEELVDGEVMELDLIHCLDRYSINICSVGFDARIAGDVHKFSKFPYVKPYTAFTISVLYNLFKGLSREYAVTVDGKRHDGDYTMLVAANARYYGGGYNPAPKADPTDGLLDFILVKKVSRIRVLQLIKKYSEGKVEELGEIATYIRGKSMAVECLGSDIEVNIDGEVVNGNRITMELAEKRVKFVAPKGCFAEWKR